MEIENKKDSLFDCSDTKRMGGARLRPWQLSHDFKNAD